MTVDTRVPYGVKGDAGCPEYDAPVYARCADRREMWVPILEKVRWVRGGRGDGV